ncbi:hypothetical protein E2320_000966 [Naja naja]|nr:hypothetical protein E2320_000966 [Naja naja]
MAEKANVEKKSKGLFPLNSSNPKKFLDPIRVQMDHHCCDRGTRAIHRSGSPAFHIGSKAALGLRNFSGSLRVLLVGHVSQEPKETFKPETSQPRRCPAVTQSLSGPRPRWAWQMLHPAPPFPAGAATSCRASAGLGLLQALRCFPSLAQPRGLGPLQPWRGPKPLRALLTHSRGIILLAQQDLGGRVGEGAAAGGQHGARLEAATEAKVGELDHPLVLEEEHVLGLEVAVHDMQAVAVGDGMHHLGEVALGPRLLQPARPPRQQVEEVPTIAQFQHQVEPGRRLQHLVEPHYVGVLHQLHAAHLPPQPRRRRAAQPALLDHLDGHALAREDVPGHSHLGKVAPAQPAAQVVEPRHLPLHRSGLPGAATARARRSRPPLRRGPTVSAALLRRAATRARAAARPERAALLPGQDGRRAGAGSAPPENVPR